MSSEAQEMAAFVTARLDEWEAAAKDAAADCPAPWRDDYGDLADASGTLIVDGAHYGGAAWRGDTIPHIVLHDPATTLRLVNGYRMILARYEDTLARQEDPDYPAGVARDQAREYEDFVLPNLAAIWSMHPDYKEGWKP